MNKGKTGRREEEMKRRMDGWMRERERDLPLGKTDW